jgi:hypothetical protein
MFAGLIALPHFSVSAARCLVDQPGLKVLPDRGDAATQPDIA